MTSDVSIQVHIGGDNIAMRLAHITGKALRGSVMRSADAVVSMVITKAVKLLDADESGGWRRQAFARRRRALLKEYRRHGKRMKARISGDRVVSGTGSRGYASVALEIGGTYDQWVKTHQRTQTYAFGHKLRAPVRVTVMEHRSSRTENNPGHYFRRAMDAVDQFADEIIHRAVYGVIEKGKIPPQTMLKKGLKP